MKHDEDQWKGQKVRIVYKELGNEGTSIPTYISEHLICEHAKGKRIIKSTTCTCPRLGMGLTSASASAVPCRKCQLKIYWTICATVGIGILRGKSINGAHVLMDKESTEKSKDHTMWELLNLNVLSFKEKIVTYMEVKLKAIIWQQERSIEEHYNGKR